jgi:hypothetical protein
MARAYFVNMAALAAPRATPGAPVDAAPQFSATGDSTAAPAGEVDFRP